MRDGGPIGAHNWSRVDMIPRSNAMPAILPARACPTGRRGLVRWRATLIPAALALGCLMCADQSGRDRAAADPRVARQAIDRANADWLDAMKREHADAIAAPYDDAGVFVTATGRSVVGKVAIAALMRERFAKEGHVVAGDVVQDGLTQAGPQMYEWGHVDLRLQRSGESTTQVQGRYLTVWSQDATGRWRILRNLSLPF